MSMHKLLTAELFGGAVVRQLSTEEMSQTQGQVSETEISNWAWDAAVVIGEAALAHEEMFASSGEAPNHNNQAFTMVNGNPHYILASNLVNISQGDPFLTDIVNVLIHSVTNFYYVYQHPISGEWGSVLCVQFGKFLGS